MAATSDAKGHRLRLGLPRASTPHRPRRRAGPGVAAEAAPTGAEHGFGRAARVRHGAAACAVGAALGRDRRCQGRRLRPGLPRASTPPRPRRRAGPGVAAEAAPTGAEHGFGRRAWIRARVRARGTGSARGRGVHRRSGAWPRPAMPKATAFAPGYPGHRRPTGPGAGPGVAAEAAPTGAGHGFRRGARVRARGMGSARGRDVRRRSGAWPRPSVPRPPPSSRVTPGIDARPAAAPGRAGGRG